MMELKNSEHIVAYIIPVTQHASVPVVVVCLKKKGLIVTEDVKLCYVSAFVPYNVICR